MTEKPYNLNYLINKVMSDHSIRNREIAERLVMIAYHRALKSSERLMEEINDLDECDIVEANNQFQFDQIFTAFFNQ